MNFFFFIDRGIARWKSLEPVTCIYGEPDIHNYHNYARQYAAIEDQSQNYIMNSRQGASAMVPGRVVMLKRVKKKKKKNFFE